jgi:hypothetical protein
MESSLGHKAGRAPWVEAVVLALLVSLVLAVGGEVVRTSYHGYLHASIGEAVRAEGLRPENPYHAGEALRYYTLYPWLGAWLGSWGIGAITAFACLNVLAALLFAPALDSLGRALGLSWQARRLAFVFALVGFNGLGWIGWLVDPPEQAAVPVFAFRSLTFAAESWGWDARLQAFLPKFLNVSSFALALAPTLWALAATMRVLEGRASKYGAWAVLLPAGLALAINPLAGGFAGICLLVWVAPRLLTAPNAERLAWCGAGLGAVVLALPFLLPALGAAPAGEKLTGTVGFQHEGWSNILGPSWFLLLFAVLANCSWPAAQRARWATAIVIAVLLAVYARLPWGNEYKPARLAGILMALPCGAWWAARLPWKPVAFASLAVLGPTTVLVVLAYLDWGREGQMPALETQAGGVLRPGAELAAQSLPSSVQAALAHEPREAVLWMNLVHPGMSAAQGLVQGNALAPALGHPLYVDLPQIHNEGIPDLAQRLAWTVGASNLGRVFGAERSAKMLAVLGDARPAGLWEARDAISAAGALAAARASLPERVWLVLTQADFPGVEEALREAGARQLAAENGISLWRLEPIQGNPARQG